MLSAYPNIKVFTSRFNDDKLLDQFVDFAAAKEVPRDEKGLEASGKQILAVLKGLIARNLYNVSAYFEVVGSTDDDLQQAVKVLGNDEMFRKLTFVR